MVRYCEYIAPPIIATVLPISAWRRPTIRPDHDAGALVADRQRLIEPPGHRLHRRRDMVAVTTGLSVVPDAFAVVMSAAPISRPRSDGLIGEASTRTTTSSGSAPAWGR